MRVLKLWLEDEIMDRLNTRATAVDAPSVQDYLLDLFAKDVASAKPPVLSTASEEKEKPRAK